MSCCWCPLESCPRTGPPGSGTWSRYTLPPGYLEIVGWNLQSRQSKTLNASGSFIDSLNSFKFYDIISFIGVRTIFVKYLINSRKVSLDPSYYIWPLRHITEYCRHLPPGPLVTRWTDTARIKHDPYLAPCHITVIMPTEMSPIQK